MTDLDRQAREKMHDVQYVQRFENERQEARVARLVEHAWLPPGARVLDVGCGTGILATMLAARYGRYTGVDFSDAMVNVARRRAEDQGLRDCEFIVANAVDVMRALPDVYDSIFMLDISEHVPDGEWSGIVQSALRALKPGGRAYLHTPNLDFLVERLKQVGLMRQFPEHIAVRTARENMRFFHEAGYSVVRCRRLPHYNVLRWFHPLSGLPLVGRYFSARLWIVAVK